MKISQYFSRKRYYKINLLISWNIIEIWVLWDCLKDFFDQNFVVCIVTAPLTLLSQLHVIVFNPMAQNSVVCAWCCCAVILIWVCVGCACLIHWTMGYRPELDSSDQNSELEPSPINFGVGSSTLSTQAFAAHQLWAVLRYLTQVLPFCKWVGISAWNMRPINGLGFNKLWSLFFFFYLIT